MLSKREIYALVGGICVLFATVTNKMLSLVGPGIELGLGLNGATICARGACVSTDDHSTVGALAFYLGLVCVAALVGAAAMDRTQDDERLWRPAGLLCLVWIFFVLVWWIEIPATGGSFGIGFWVGLPGAAAAAYVSLSSDGLGVGAQNERAAERVVDIEAGLDKYRKIKPPQDAPAPEAGVAVAAPASLGSEAAPAPAHRPKAQFRFVATKMVISDQGVVATFGDGQSQELLFGALKQIVARRLPRELGYGPALLLDLVPAATPDRPIRILPSTQVNYQFLPEGESDDPSVNAKRLATLMTALQPDLPMDEGSKLFVSGAGTGLPFKSVDHFWEYDGRYPA
jgi:hypothetical protein